MSNFGLKPARPKQPRDRGPALSKQTRMRIAAIEDRLAKGETTGDISRDLVDTHGVHPRTVRRWMRSAELRWQAESDASGREGRKGQLRAVAWAFVRAALARKGLALDRDGGEHWYDNPDVGGGGRVLEFLARLDGDLEQPASLLPEGFADDVKRELHMHFYGSMPAATVTATARVVESESAALPAGDDERGK